MSSDAWQQSEPSLHDGGLTVFAGSSFALTDASGEMRAEPQGFFVADQRALSQLRLSLDEHETVVLRAGLHGDDEAQVVRRVTPASGGSAPALLLSTTLQVSAGSLQVRLLFRNSDAVERFVSWSLTLAADFADIFAVKEGRVAARAGQHRSRVVADRLELVGDSMTTVVTSRDGAATVSPRGVTEGLRLPPRATVERVVDIEAVPAGRPAAAPAVAVSRRLHRPQLATRSTELATAVDSAFDDIQALRIHDPETGADTLAAGAPWFMTLFGRDSLLTSIMLAPFDQDLGLQVLKSLAQRQGRVVDAVSEEEPGRIVHETRMSADVSLFEGRRTRYYGSTDATPLFVITAAELVRNGLPLPAIHDVMPAVDRCLGWIDKYGDLDGDGFVESVRRSDGGLVNQGWKDSWNAIVDERGAVVDPPVALVEVQAYVYAALRSRAYLARVLDESSGAVWDSRARQLRTAIDRAYWLPGMSTYALALGPDGAPLASSTSNAGHLLWTGAALPERAAPLAATLMSRRLRTHWGIRTLAADHAAYDPLGYHIGSVWPHDTALIAWGLSRWGFGRAAAETSAGLVRAAAYFGGTLPELMSGLDASDPVAGGSPVRFPTACSPQAWAAAAPLLALRAVLGLEVDRPNRTVHLNPHVPDAWLPLTLHQIRSGGERLLVRAGASGHAEVVGLPPDSRVERRPLFRE
jgi:glycogen debranching enzyme